MGSSDQIDLAASPPFRIGRLTVEPAMRQVTAAVSETLEPRVMQVLVQLAMANGGIVSRDDLVRRCWEGRIVGNDVINRVIARLRRLLEEHGDAAVRIETITKVGYRLIGPVVLTVPSVRAPLATETIEATIAPTSAPAGAPTTGNRRWWWVIAIAAVSLLALAVMPWRAAHPTSKPLQAQLQVGAFKVLSDDVQPEAERCEPLP
jgi:DNA-binding winged helix-turn-helix (wHTH) protein